MHCEYIVAVFLMLRGNVSLLQKPGQERREKKYKRKGKELMAAISNDWAEALKEEYRKPYYRELYNTINKEYREREIFPPAEDIFNAFHLTPLKDVKVVILGQDPYHNNGQAHGLCFSVRPEV